MSLKSSKLVCALDQGSRQRIECRYPYTPTSEFRVSSNAQIKEYMIILHTQIRERFRMTDENCGFSEKTKNGKVEYYLEAWPHGIKVAFIHSELVEIWLTNECEGVSHDGIREVLNNSITKIINLVMQIK